VKKVSGRKGKGLLIEKFVSNQFKECAEHLILVIIYELRTLFHSK
jgi:hypothetical protein